MKYLFYSFLIYWIYNRFFAPTAPPPPRQRDDYDAPRQNPSSKKQNNTEGEFIDYEELK